MSKPGKSTNLTLVSDIQAYFHELVTQSLERNKLKVHPETEFYLVNLMRQFMSADHLFARDQNGHSKEEPVALMVKEALEEPRPEAQKLLFRHVGDICLYVSGFFQESLKRKLVDVDYYIDMGGTAYRNVAARADAPTFRDLYHDLATRFPAFVGVFEEISVKTTPKTEKDLLRIYENWVNTRSDKAARALQEAGILPNDTIKKGWQ